MTETTTCKAVAAIVALLLMSGVCPAESVPPAAQSDGKAAAQPARMRELDLGEKVRIKFVQIPAGKFLMGSPRDEKGRLDNEGPQRQVTVSKPFFVGVYPVTQEQYEAVMGKNPSTLKGPGKPVETVNWDDAVAFCKQASAKTGTQFRFRRRPSGSMPAGRAARPGISSGTMKRSLVTTPGLEETAADQHIRSVRRSPTPGGCMTW
jgi:formylglycine-generating enzyme required for sulfatase activity